ncbi:MAG: hypothetical protein ABIJ09_17900 [Pseudomonadota bacterium]
MKIRSQHPPAIRALPGNMAPLAARRGPETMDRVELGPSRDVQRVVELATAVVDAPVVQDIRALALEGVSVQQLHRVSQALLLDVHLQHALLAGEGG